MMLLDSFYHIIYTETDPEISFRLKIDPNHEIFKGHFPNLPIVPGVFMIKMVRELLSINTGRKLLLVEGTNIKFLTIINASINNIIDVNIEILSTDDKYLVANALIKAGNNICMKIKGKYKII